MKLATAIATALFLLLARCLPAEPISPAVHGAVMVIADNCGVPRSVANQLQIEESGWWQTRTWGDARAVNRSEPGGYSSCGLFQLYMKPSNIKYLLDKYWDGYGETRAFDVFDPIDNATVALRYLADLHRQGGTWFAAYCLYNSGTMNAPEETRARALRIVRAP